MKNTTFNIDSFIEEVDDIVDDVLYNLSLNKDNFKYKNFKFSLNNEESKTGDEFIKSAITTRNGTNVLISESSYNTEDIDSLEESFISCISHELAHQMQFKQGTNDRINTATNELNNHLYLSDPNELEAFAMEAICELLIFNSDADKDIILEGINKNKDLSDFSPAIDEYKNFDKMDILTNKIKEILTNE